MLTACSEPLVKRVEYAKAPDIAATATPAPIKYSGIELLLPPGMRLGNARGGVFCTSPSYPINRNILHKEIDHKFLRQTFHDALEANGYDVVGSLDVVFAPEDEAVRGDYSIKAKLKDVQLDMCSHGSITRDWLTGETGEAGSMYIAIDWSVYDFLKRTVVYKTRTEGYTNRRIPNTEGMSLLFDDAFEMAAHNLAADENFRALIFDGTKPPKEEDGIDWRGEKLDARPRLYDSQEEVTLTTQPLSRQPFAKTAPTGKNASVMVQKSGHGSGFFITKQGHILTNAHVVGEARRVRIVTGFKKTGITAEVLRLDRARDVALLKLEEIPNWLAKEDIPILPIRLDWPKVGEDIYALGVPKNWKSMRNTLTKGIVSAHRRFQRQGGIRLNFIQGDVEVHPGSSGGPLLDEYGNIVGITVEAEPFSNENGSRIGIGLNRFIPIEEALNTLNIHY